MCIRKKVRRVSEETPPPPLASAIDSSTTNKTLPASGMESQNLAGKHQQPSSSAVVESPCIMKGSTITTSPESQNRSTEASSEEKKEPKNHRKYLCSDTALTSFESEENGLTDEDTKQKVKPTTKNAVACEENGLLFSTIEGEPSQWSTCRMQLQMNKPISIAPTLPSTIEAHTNQHSTFVIGK